MSETIELEFFNSALIEALNNATVLKNKKLRVIIYYHGHCKAHDGSMSAAVAKYFITKFTKQYNADIRPEFTFEGITYGTKYDKNIIMNQDLVVFVDFMFTELQDNLQIMSDANCPIIICDHHNDKRVESIHEYNNFNAKSTNTVDIQFNTSFSGVSNTIKYFDRYKEHTGLGESSTTWDECILNIINCINDYDMWEWKFKDTAAINAYFSTFTDEDNITFVYDLINNQDYYTASGISKIYRNIVETGNILERNKAKRVDSSTNKYVEVHLPMHLEKNGCVLDRTYSFAVVNSISDKNECADVFTPTYDFVIVWAFQGNYITGSIRAQKDKLDGFMDANILANLSEYGMVGGGHPSAAGFSVKDPSCITKFLERFVYGAKPKKLSQSSSKSC